MSRFFSDKFAALTPYTPGEQPQDKQYIKLNTNESPFPPSPSVALAAREEGEKLHLYSDPENLRLRQKLAERYGVKPSQVIVSNGSDDVLNYAFMAFGDEQHPMLFPDISYGFYPVFAKLNRIPYTEAPLTADFRVDIKDYVNSRKTVVLANPNAPTGIALGLEAIEQVLSGNPDNVVIVDEAYVDFGGESALSLLPHYENLLVVRTFSKSRSLAGARLGFAIGSEELIRDLNTIKYSINPYSVNRMTEACGIAALEEDSYYMDNCRTIMETRCWTIKALEALGMEVLPSSTNFIFAKSDKIDGEKMYVELKKRGILVRHFASPRIREYNRITIGTQAQMERLGQNIEELLKDC